MKTSRLVAGAAMAAGVLLLQSPAFSQFDGQTIPGVGCTKIGSSGTLASWFGTIMNTHTSSALSLMCPLATPKQLTPGPEWDLYATAVQVFDRHSSQDVSCVRYSEYVSGSSYFSEDDPANTTGSSASVKTINFGAEDPIYNHHYLTCSLPPEQNGSRSHLISVQYLSRGLE
ncbi:MAG TPA: hypothetical protein VFU02_06540 [Polyangiaceae bacterium]|nr:hypothetical protein [Polyangiaceae bacterium]